MSKTTAAKGRAVTRKAGRTSEKREVLIETGKHVERMVRIDARIPSHIKEIVQYAASLQGRSQTDFMVTAIHEAAQKVIADNSVIRLCIEDQMDLAAALREDAPQPATKGLARLRRAVREHGKKVVSR